MSNSSSVPTIQFGPVGPILPKESDILAGVQADMNAAFGGNLNPALSTPQGQLASSQTAAIAATNDLFAQFIAGIDPATSSGFMQDAIGRLYFLDRIPATSTSVQVLCTGLANTLIPAGSMVADSSGNLYASTAAATIPAGGSITVSFNAAVAGPTPCPAGAITTIYKAIPGWDTVSNAAAGVVGRNVESRADFEYRRQQSVAINGAGTLPAIYANVFACAGVTDVYAVENYTGSTVNTGATNYPMLPHSIYIAVVGGAAADIANAIWKRKDTGCDCNGNTSVTVTDGAYSYPQPSYTIKFQTPTNTPVLFAVQIANNPALPSDIVTQVKNAIVSAFSGGDGGPRARIGATIYASRFYAPVTALSSAVSILSLQIGTATANQSSVAIGIDQVPVVSAANVSVTLV